MNSPKLTKPQKELLRDLATKGPEYVIDIYAPGKKLWVLGYVTRREGVFGKVELTITEAGRAAHASLNESASHD